MGRIDAPVIRQHLIDPEICIRCNTCEATCPVGAITHDSRNYVVDAEKCDLCMACIPPCPTGSIDNWRTMPRALAYGLDAQLSWDALPAELSVEELADAGVPNDVGQVLEPEAQASSARTSEEGAFQVSDYAAVIPPWSAAHPYVNLYGPRTAEKTIAAVVAGNVRVTEVGKDYDTHHIVLDFGATPFPVLEGQSIGVIPPGLDERRKAAPPPPVLDRKSAQRRAAGLQQCVADGEARARGPSGPAGARRGEQLSLRPRCRRQG